MFLLCSFAMFAMGWMALLPGLFTSVIKDRTGFPVRVEYFYANPFTAEVRMRGLLLMNPSGFKETDFVELQEFSAKADLFSLLGSSPVLDMTTINMNRVSVVTNASGVNNLDLIYSRLAPSSKTAAKSGGKSAQVETKKSPLQFLVRNLNVRLNEVVVKDERPGKSPAKVHEIAFQRSYRDVVPTTTFNDNLPVAMAEAGKSIENLVSGDLKKLVANATQPIDRTTYAWGDKKENAAGAARKLEEMPKP